MLEVQAVLEFLLIVIFGRPAVLRANKSEATVPVVDIISRVQRMEQKLRQKHCQFTAAMKLQTLALK